MQTQTSTLEQVAGFRPDIDQLESLGTQIQWKHHRTAEAGTVLLAPETDGPPIHLHPVQQEEFCIRQGELMVYKKDKWLKLSAGDRITIPARTAHTYRNASKETVLFDFYLTPRLRFRQMMEEMDAYVQADKIRGTDPRSLLYLCRVMNEFPDVTRSVRPPQFVVRIMAALSRVFQK